MSEKEKQHCGFVAIVGRPNVGKSTLLNALLGQKVSITSRKPQTTRHRIMGIHTEGAYQTIYIDTPGLHIEEKRAINRLMNRAASSAIGDVELIIFVVEGTHWIADDEMVMNKLSHVNCPVLLVINKMDNVTDKAKLLPHIDFLRKKINFIGILPVIAEASEKKQRTQEGKNLDTIADIVRKHMPEAEHHFPEDYITDRSQRFMASEMIREKLMRFLGEELPYSVTVEIERFVPFAFEVAARRPGLSTDERRQLRDSASTRSQQRGGFKGGGYMTNKRKGYNINGLILVERDGQKKIVIGDKGEKIKKIGTEAREEMEKMFACKIHLELWVKVKSGWADDERALRSLGYGDD